jgi:imidazole glycerol phosphate synthase glutamine amidotransferase subunit
MDYFNNNFVIPKGVGNCGSILKFLNQRGFTRIFEQFEKEVSGRDILVLPGVGHFKHYIKSINQRGINNNSIKNFIEAGGQVIGICAGFQVLFSGSEEAPDEQGLALIDGRVQKLRFDVHYDQIGWSQTHSLARNKEIGNLYYNNGYGIKIDQNSDCIEATYYQVGTERFYASLKKINSIIGFQYHPEISGKLGAEYFDKILHK